MYMYVHIFYYCSIYWSDTSLRDFKLNSTEYEIYPAHKCYSESMERSLQTIMKVSSKSLNYLPICFSNSMADSMFTLNLERTLELISFIFISIFISDGFKKTSVLSTSHVTIQGTCWK